MFKSSQAHQPSLLRNFGRQATNSMKAACRSFSEGGPVFVSGLGAIAQLGERVLCKHEVVGSIPTGSTSRLNYLVHENTYSHRSIIDRVRVV
jgi:hypothetical protein